MRRTGAALVIVLSAACGNTPEPSVGWQVVHEDLEGALLRVWGTSSTDVYAVGSDPNNSGSLVLHFDGDKWTRLVTGTTGDLWWLHQVGDDDIRMVGDRGLVLRYKPSDGSFTKLTAPSSTPTLFGVFGREANDVWYVGGVPSNRGTVWRQTDPLAIAELDEVPTPTSAAVYKAHGFDDGKVWMVGDGGLTSLWDGTSFTDHPAPTASTLFTVHGPDADHVFAVGGLGQGVLLRWSGTTWVDETPPFTGQINGVWAVDRDHVYAAGYNGTFMERKNGVWLELGSTLSSKPTLSDIHSIWVDEKGGIWAVGGQIVSDPPRDGVMVHYGQHVATGL